MDSTKNSVPSCMDKGAKTCKSIVRYSYLLKVVFTVLLFFEMYSLAFVAFPFVVGTPIYILAALAFATIPTAGVILGIVLLFVLLVTWFLVLPFLMLWKSEKVFFVGNIVFTVLNLADAVCFIGAAVISCGWPFIIGTVFNAAMIAVSVLWIFKTSKKRTSV